jgi:hypothetical protein
MYAKLNSFYKSDEPDPSGLNIEELEQVAEEIRLILVGVKGLTLTDYVNRATKISFSELGHRRVYSVKNEPRMSAYFPEEVWNILKKRCDETKLVKFYRSDDEFISLNKGKGTTWVAIKTYSDPSTIYKKFKKLKIIDFNRRRIRNYDSKTLTFIRENIEKGISWISKQLGLSYDAVRSKCRRENLIKPKMFFHYYTNEENRFIKENIQKGIKYIAEILKVSPDAIRKHAEQIGINICQQKR